MTDNSWHLDKRVNAGHILTTIALAVALFTWASSMQEKQAVTMTKVENIQANQALQTDALRKEITYLRGSIDKLNDKLDRLR
jgi:cell division protein FtsB